MVLLSLPGGSYRAQSQPVKSAGASSAVSVSYAKHALQGFDLKVWTTNQMTIGQESWDGGLPDPYGIGVEYPAGSGIEHVFGGGPWIGGIVNGARRVSEAYNGDNANKYFRPDPSHPLRELIWRTSVGDSLTEPNGRGCDDDCDGSIDEDDLDGLDNDGDWDMISDDLGADGLPDELESGCGGGYDPSLNPDPGFDNFDSAGTDFCRPDRNGNYSRKSDPDLYTERNGIPDHGEPHVDEDYGAVSDNDLYCSARDDNDVPGGHYPMGIKLLQKSYAWQDPGYGAIVLFDYYFINAGSNIIQEVYIGYFLDADVGPASTGNYWVRNYSCYFDSLHTAYTHNPIDRGTTPIGLSLLGAPKRLDSLKMVFQWFDFTTRPSPGTSDSAIYWWMSAEGFPEQPIATCQSPTGPTDTRFLFSFGPFEAFRPGDTLKVSWALVSGSSVSHAPGSMTENVLKANLLHDRMKNPGAVLPRSAPPSPALEVVKDNASVSLKWGPSVGTPDPTGYWDISNRLAESYPDDHWRRNDPPCNTGGSTCIGLGACDSTGGLPGGRTFEGYRLYRSVDPSDNPTATSFTLVKEYDIEGDAIGYDFGLDSAYVDTNLRVGNRYWYAVTSFAIPDMQITARLNPAGSIYYDTTYFEGLESSLWSNMIKVDLTFRASGGPDQVLVVPNPYRGDMDYSMEGGGWEGSITNWTDYKRKIRFIHLPAHCTIRIFTVAGDIVADLKYHAPADDPNTGQMDWPLIRENGRPIASGIYVYTVESEFGTEYGKFVIIR